MLRTKELTYQYKNGPKLTFPDISCGQGEHWLLLGQSGCGKTTLLHLLGGLLRPSSGSIQVGDTDIGALSASKLDHFRGRNIGIVFQKPHFVRSLSVEKNLSLARYLVNERPYRQGVDALLGSLNLEHKLKSMPHRLSQGEQQRVAIARAVINQPQLILADEPTSALDDDNCLEVIRLLEAQAKAQNAVLLIVTHDQRLKDHFPNQIGL